MHTIPTLLLLGGENKRMNGHPKALLPLGDKTFLEHITTTLSPCGPIYLSVRTQDQFSDLPYPILVDKLPGIGPLGGIYTALKALDADCLFVTACDMPFITQAVVDYLYAQLTPTTTALIFSDTTGKFNPLGGLYTPKLLPYLETAIATKNYRLGYLLKQANATIIPISSTPFNEKILRNVNTPEDYQKLL